MMMVVVVELDLLPDEHHHTTPHHITSPRRTHTTLHSTPLSQHFFFILIYIEFNLIQLAPYNLPEVSFLSLLSYSVFSFPFIDCQPPLSLLSAPAEFP
jgi:hypothetical protein